MRAGYTFLVLALILPLASCALYLSRAERVKVDATVTFFAPDGTPLANEPAYIVEGLGNGYRVTEITKTDDNGMIRLSGYYCAPLHVEVDGGDVVITSSAIADHYEKVVRADRRPPRTTDYWSAKERAEFKGSITQRFCSSLMF